MSLQKQAAILFCKVVGVPQSVVPKLLGVNHKAVENMSSRLHEARAAYVVAREEHIVFGSGSSWEDVEGDEATFDKRDVSGGDDQEEDIKNEHCMQWEQWSGLVQRGRPETLVLSRLSPKLSVKHAPGPGAITKCDWKPLAAKHLQGRKVIFHTDSARSYRLKIKDVLHDAVVHQKKRVKVKGKWTWKTPTYVKIFSHTLPGGKKLKTKGGTQIIDRCWRFIKDRIKRGQNVHTKAGSRSLLIRIRSAQWEYWHKNDDNWLQTGHMLTWHQS